MQGFNPADVPTAYGDTLTFWDWQQRRVTQTVKLGPDGLIPLELRFLHDPAQPHGYVGAALSSNVIHFTKASCSVWARHADARARYSQEDSPHWVLPFRLYLWKGAALQTRYWAQKLFSYQAVGSSQLRHKTEGTKEAATRCHLRQLNLKSRRQEECSGGSPVDMPRGLQSYGTQGACILLLCVGSICMTPAVHSEGYVHHCRERPTGGRHTSPSGRSGLRWRAGSCPRCRP